VLTFCVSALKRRFVPHVRSRKCSEHAAIPGSLIQKPLQRGPQVPNLLMHFIYLDTLNDANLLFTHTNKKTFILEKVGSSFWVGGVVCLKRPRNKQIA